MRKSDRCSRSACRLRASSQPPRYFPYVVKRMTPSYPGRYVLAMKATLPTTPWSSQELGELRAALLGHYDRHQRGLPWRGESDPYRVLVSEVMLQQTRVETVALRYAGWLERFPHLESVAAAAEDEVLKAWEGLGYYRRARNLHQTALLVRERPDGALPMTYEEL